MIIKDEMFWGGKSDALCLSNLQDTQRRSRTDLTEYQDLRWDQVQAWSWLQVGIGKALEVLQSNLGDCICLGSNPQLLPSPHTQMTAPTLSSSSCVGWQSFLPMTVCV